METLQAIMRKNANYEYTCHDLLKGLCDIYSKPHDETSLTRLFDEIAVGLLRQTKIVTPKEQFFIREIEFYFYNKEFHPDPYVHKHERQRTFGEWYFHRYTVLEKFLKNNRNGLDITFGNEGAFGGILIRKIENVETKKMIVGINKIARALINNIGNENVSGIALGHGQQAFNKNNQVLRLDNENNSIAVPIYKTQRNGLTFYEDELSRKYLKIPYCYFNHDLNVTQILQVR